MKAVRYVALLAAAALALTACGDDADAIADPTGEVTIEAGDLYFDPENVAALAGEIEFTLVNAGSAEHDLVVEEAGDTEVVFVEAGETGPGSITLDAGTYTIYCSVVGHREAGMEGTLEVS